MAQQGKKESRNMGVVVALFVLLFIIGIGSGYILLSRGSSKPEQSESKIEQQREEVVVTKSLVETPPPLPEETPTLPVQDAGVEAEGKVRPKKRVAIPMGTIDPDVVKSFIRKHKNKVRACYERELKRNAILQGKVVTSITINPDGSVANVKFLSDSVHSSAMNRCIRKEISSWTFPRPRGGRVVVQFPFRFEPKQD